MRAVRATVGVVGELVVTFGVLVLLFVAWQLWWTDVSANREQSLTAATLERSFAAPAPSSPGKPLAKGASPPPPAAVLPGDAFALMRIPRFGATNVRPVLEGTDTDTLTRGLGHYPDTAMPGQVGNFVVAGHRTTYGRPLHDIDKMRVGDLVIVELRASYVIYAVDRYEIVNPDRVDVAAAVPERPGVTPTAAWLTLTTCNPKYSAKQRYIVFAKMSQVIPRSAGIPAALLAAPAGA